MTITGIPGPLTRPRGCIHCWSISSAFSRQWSSVYQLIGPMRQPTRKFLIPLISSTMAQHQHPIFIQLLRALVSRLVLLFFFSILHIWLTFRNATMKKLTMKLHRRQKIRKKWNFIYNIIVYTTCNKAPSGTQFSSLWLFY